MLPTQNKALMRICNELQIKDISELKGVLIDNYDKSLIPSQWSEDEETAYIEFKEYLIQNYK